MKYMHEDRKLKNDFSRDEIPAKCAPEARKPVELTQESLGAHLLKAGVGGEAEIVHQAYALRKEPTAATATIEQTRPYKETFTDILLAYIIPTASVVGAGIAIYIIMHP